MRLSVDKWILTTVKKNESSTENSSNQLVLDQQVTVEQNLYEEPQQVSNETEIKQNDYNIISEQQDVQKQIHLIETKLVKSAHKIERISSTRNVNKQNTKTMNKFKMFDERTTNDNYYQGEFKQDNSNRIEQDHKEKMITIITTTTTFTSSWQSLIEHLNKCLDIFTMRDVTNIIEDLIKLENYLNNEISLNEREIYFSTQQKIVETLNETLKAKLFNLSQSSNLFNDLKKKLSILLTARLSSHNLAETLVKFEQLENDYFTLLESIKSKVKLKIAKYENNLQIWNEFDFTCKQLNLIFERNSNHNSTSLEYRSLLIEISNYLNKLKEQLSQLASVCDENKYFELKNHIIVFELKFKKLRSVNDQLHSTNSASNSSNSETNSSFEMRHLKHYQSEQDLCKTPQTPQLRNRYQMLNEQSVPTTPKKNYCNQCLTHDQEITNNLLRKRLQADLVASKKLDIQTADKSTFTVNEISTQTDYYNQKQKNDLNNNSTNDKLKHLSYYHSNSANTAATESIELNYNKTTKYKTIINTESDGKKLLLEAYLRNNTENRCSSSSSCSRALNQKNLSNQSNNREITTTLTTTTTRESGIGTYNEDEVESLQSANRDDYFLNDFNENIINFEINKKLKQIDTNTKLKDDYLTDQSEELNKKYFSKKYRKKSNRKIVPSSTSSVLSSSIGTSSEQLISLKQEVNLKSDSLNSYDNKSIKKQEQQKTKTMTAFATAWLISLFKKICTIIMFFFPLVFLIAVYFFYILFLNPSCCDLKRNYLFINIS